MLKKMTEKCGDVLGELFFLNVEPNPGHSA